MIELTTGVVFLMSSLYGSGQAEKHIENMDMKTEPQAVQATAMNISLFTQNPKGMEAYIRAAVGEDQILVDIARCESSFRQFDTNGDLIRGKANSADVGVMQINEKYQGPTAKKLGYDIYTVEGNVAYAKHLYEEQGSAPWSASSKCWSSPDLAKK
jgi:hypothetical protein